ncbi:hypothetical protein AAHH88_00300 [Candidatus Hodgkinia cicadicola]
MFKAERSPLNKALTATKLLKTCAVTSLNPLNSKYSSPQTQKHKTTKHKTTKNKKGERRRKGNGTPPTLLSFAIKALKAPTSGKVIPAKQTSHNTACAFPQGTT